ncbi:cofactor-independent phosphoglycerate mutase [Lacipirellula limnantheis]|uniref:Cofactor-independent phosphoglycerate mutase n=1 Tax=Lacipirellula limnantheis TaxID=2528024 RepID=A0A517TUP4_9BACT|nr:cofactor-independent phosphoglycerate mutase [Lacipirellula limnantheis]QDT72096.1 cofactor-independent phosphoglycerate mutase [Lacipirellula limnantheis]
MKYAIIIPDGAADEPQESLGGKTPLEAAHTPAMDALVAAGVIARACHTPKSLPAGSEVGNMSLLGYDPLKNFTGRAPIEAAAQGIELGAEDWAVRCNLVTVEDQVMRDFTADHISTEEATKLLATMQEYVAADTDLADVIHFVPGVSYRNLMIWRGVSQAAPFSMETRATPPHDLTDKSITEDFPRGPGSDVLVSLMEKSVELFKDHPVNVVRQGYGKLPATNVWLWGLGRAPTLERFDLAYGVHGAMITAVDLLRGLATLVGWKRIEVEGATGYIDTDYAAKGRAAIAALDDVDLICVHIEAPDEASHQGDVKEKVKAIEEIDRHVVAPLVEALKARGDYRVMISPDHPTFVRTKTHTHGDVPVAMAGTGIKPDEFTSYGDTNAAKSSLAFDEGWRAMEWFIKK